ncbi:MAG TPA: DUF952 domain-containing protein [Parvularcula sp.]|nr:DUF952 domain-containing protein [Parvularcula sp.]
MKEVFKIMGEADRARSAAAGFVERAPVDRADGYIHLSAEDQVLETARLHFAGRDDLVAVAFNAGDLGPALKWEASRGGALFPHYYGALAMGLARAARRLVRRADGTFAFGEAIG